MKTYAFILVAAAAWLPCAPGVGAQQPAPLSAARVTLVAGDAPSKGGRTEVVRQARHQPQNVVIVDRNASADDLAAALAIVNALRARYGDSLASDYRARPEPVVHGAKSDSSEYRKWLQQQLVRLRKAPERELDPFGTVKAVHITLPPPNGTIVKPEGTR